MTLIHDIQSELSVFHMLEEDFSYAEQLQLAEIMAAMVPPKPAGIECLPQNLDEPTTPHPIGLQNTYALDYVYAEMLRGQDASLVGGLRDAQSHAAAERMSRIDSTGIISSCVDDFDAARYVLLMLTPV